MKSRINLFFAENVLNQHEVVDSLVYGPIEGNSNTAQFLIPIYT